MVAFLEHYLNPLHVFCRLRNFGLGKSSARFICTIYEKIIFGPIVSRTLKTIERLKRNTASNRITNGCWLK